MKLIVAVDKNWAIGKNGTMMWNIPEDMKFFRTTTKDSVVIMGRKTLESFPGKKPLKNRMNIVITRDKNYTVDGEAIVVNSVQEAVKRAQQVEDKEVFVIGGETIYRAMLDYCDTAYITKIDNAYDADTYFPNLDKMEDWQCSYQGEELDSNGVKFRFTTYIRKQAEI